MTPQRYKRRSNDHGSSDEHHMIVERVLGMKLPFEVPIHHVDGNIHNNSHNNLVVCQDQAYHKLLHTRTEALDACGHADWRRCWCCGTYDKKENLHVKIGKTNQNGEGSWTHRSCLQLYMRNYYQKRKSCL